MALASTLANSPALRTPKHPFNTAMASKFKKQIQEKHKGYISSHKLNYEKTNVIKTFLCISIPHALNSACVSPANHEKGIVTAKSKL